MIKYTEYLKKFNPELLNIFSNKNIDLLDSLYEIFKENGILDFKTKKIYLVGGIVRDILLGKATNDIDITVNFNPIEIANIIIKKFQIKKYKHSEKFSTYNIFLESKTNIDIAQFRTEIYETAGGLPSISLENELEKDFIRRDFTVNAMYISFDNELNFFDPFNGLEDLKNKKIKILHEKSFYEDPTRIFRAIKFSARYNFDFDKITSNLLYTAIEKNYVFLISDTRLKTELYNLLFEKNKLKIITLMKKYGILKSLDFYIPEETEIINLSNFLETKYFNNLEEKNKDLEVEFLLMYFIKNMDYEKKLKFLLKMKMKNKKIEDIIFDDREVVLEKISKSISDFDIYCVLKNLSFLKLIFILYILEKKKSIENIKKIECFIEILSKIKILVSGKDFFNLGITDGKIIKKCILESIKYQFNMKNKSKEEIIKIIILKQKLGEL